MASIFAERIRLRNLLPFLIRCLLLITVFSGSHAYTQLQPSSSHTKDASPKKAAGQAIAVKADWREQLTRNVGAPVKIMEFFDYQCPYCGSTIPALHETLKNNSGQVQLILKHNPLAIHPDSMLAHQAALAAGEQGRFWEMHDLLFAHQRKLKLPDLLDYARQLHLNLPLFQKRLESGYYKAAVEQDIALADALGVDGTPTFFINGQKLIGAQSAARLQSAITGKPDSEATKGDTIAVSSLDLAHSPVRGAPDAAITIIEFSDFQCPFCARVVPTLQQLLEQYPARVKWIFKNYPLDFHADSPLAHRAVLAAGEQGKFWEMHDLIFAGQAFIKKDDLLQKARSLKLDMAKFTADLESDKLKQEVEADQQEGAALGVNGTPTFFINGKAYSGAMPLSQFQAIINAELAAGPARTLPEMPASGQNEPEIAFGSSHAPITLIWFSDLQSNLTVKATLLVRQIMHNNPEKIRLVFKNRPLESHPDSMMLHQAAMAANAQGKFWEMHDLIIANPQKTAKQDLISYAQRIGLDVQRFQAELEADKYRPFIEHDLNEARRRSVLGTPVFFLNTARIDGLQPQKMFDDLIAAQLGKQIQASSH